jgi:glycosyltransferase involved in cell wall biosynthesis
MPDFPTVSVYIPTRNRRKQLGNCLRGVLSQQAARLDVIVVDDASTDGTPRYLRRLAKRGLLRCVLIDQQAGAQAARNRAIAEARGEFITGADDDDVWLPGRMAAMLDAMQGGVAFVAATDIMDLGDGTRYLQRRPAVITADALLRRNVVGNQVLTRTATLRACGPFDESLPASQDYDLWIRLALHAGDGRGIDMPLQWVEASASRKRISTSRNRRIGVWRVYRKHRPIMNQDQRRAHLFNVLRTLDRPLSFATARTFCRGGEWRRAALHLLRSLIPAVDRWSLLWISHRQRAVIDAALATCTSRSRGAIT